jgi:hypothetical protein
MAYNSIISVQAVYSPPVTLQTTSGILEPWTNAECRTAFRKAILRTVPG